MDRFERTQDINLGTRFSLYSTIANTAFGSDRNAIVLAALYGTGTRLDNTSFLRGEFSGSTRIEKGQSVNSLYQAEGRYYKIFGPKFWKEHYMGTHTLAVRASLISGYDLDGEREFSIGADRGLRGYKARAFNGDQAFMLNIEHRATVAENVFNLMSVGVAGFVDIGGASSRQLNDLFGNRLYSDVGVGLRLGFPRSGSGGVARIDIAVPMRDGPEGSNAYEIRVLFSAGNPFDATLPGESSSVEQVSLLNGVTR
jgi:hemolysin activation/secretion protein